MSLSSDQLVYFGTGSSQIHFSRFNSEGKLTEPEAYTVGDSPTWLTANPIKDLLFLVSEEGGRLSSFNFHRSSGEVTKINEVPTFGGATCHCQLDATQTWLGVVNYLSGNYSLNLVNPDGSITEPPVFAHQNDVAGGIAHPHQIVFTPDNRFIFIPDLGLDQIMQYEFDATNRTEPVKPNRYQPMLQIAKGAGPRHLAISPIDPNVFFGSNELDSTLNVYVMNPSQGTLELIQTVSTLLSTFNGTNSVAEIVSSKCGRFVYVSNRGDDSIAKFRVSFDRDFNGDGTVTTNHPRVALESVVSCGGSWPRFIGFDLSYRYMFATNQHSDNVAVFRVDTENGELLLEYTVPIPCPQHAIFISNE